MKRWLIALIALFTFLLFLELPGSWLFDPDETRYAEIPREMLATGDYVTPRLNGSLYFEKPPLLYWLNAGSMALFGQTPFAARLPTRLATLGTAILLILFLSSSAPNAGLWAALIFLSAPLSFALGRINLTDGILSFSMTWAFLALRAYLQRSEKYQRTWPAELALGTGMGLAVLSKGLIGIVFPVLVLVLWAAIHGQWGQVTRLLFSWAPVVCLAISLPWFVLVEKANPGFCRFFFIHEHFLRYATTEAARPGTLYYFALTFFLGFLPWSLLFIKAVWPLMTLRRKIWRRYPDESFFFLWFLSILIFFSISESKLIPYILPAFPAACALVGKKLGREPELSIPWKIQAPLYLMIAAGITVASTIKSVIFATYDLEIHAILIAMFLVGAAGAGVILSKKKSFLGHATHFFSWSGVYLVLVMAVPRLAEHYADYGLASKAQQTPSAYKVCYETFSNSFPWVQKAPVPVAKYAGEFPSIGERLPSLFWNQEQFFKRWNSPERLVVIVRKKSLEHFASSPRKPVILAANRRSFLVANFDATQARREKSHPSYLPSILAAKTN